MWSKPGPQLFVFSGLLIPELRGEEPRTSRAGHGANSDQMGSPDRIGSPSKTKNESDGRSFPDRLPQKKSVPRPLRRSRILRRILARGAHAPWRVRAAPGLSSLIDRSRHRLKRSSHPAGIPRSSPAERPDRRPAAWPATCRRARWSGSFKIFNFRNCQSRPAGSGLHRAEIAVRPGGRPRMIAMILAVRLARALPQAPKTPNRRRSERSRSRGYRNGS